MSTTYSLLCKIRLTHDYFPEGSYPSIEVRPTSETQRLMQQLGLRMVAREDGVELYYTNEPSAQEALMAAVADQLSFILRANDSLFLNYTEIPINHGQEIIYHLTNLAPQAGPFQIKDSATLPHSAAGSRPGDLALLIIYLGDNETGATPMISDGMVAPAVYTFAFSARETIWRYNIIDSMDHFKNHRIVWEDEVTTDFPEGTEAPPIRVMPDNSKATVISSTRPLPLRKIYDRRLELRMDLEEGGREQNVSIPLPYPGPDRISNEPLPGADAVPSYFSDVYFYA